MNVEREFKPDYYSLRLLKFHKFPLKDLLEYDDQNVYGLFLRCVIAEKWENKVLLDYLPCLSCYFYRSIKIFLNVLFTCLNRIVGHVEIFLQSARWIMGELKSRYLGFGGKRSFHP